VLITHITTLNDVKLASTFAPHLPHAGSGISHSHFHHSCTQAGGMTGSAGDNQEQASDET